MKRYAMQNLVKWKGKDNRKPLVLKGARQVGKTWLMKEFGRRYFKKVAYVTFYNNQRMKDYEDTIEWLLDCGLISKSYKVSFALIRRLL